MRRFLLWVSVLFLAPTGGAVAQLDVFACEPEWASLSKTLGGDRVDVHAATTAFQDPHHIQARPSLIAKTRSADLLVCSGAELEVGWLPLLLRRSGNSDIQRDSLGYFMATDVVDLLDVPAVVDRSMGDVHAAGNPHVHWDPNRLLVIAQALSERLQRIDPQGQAYYAERFLAFEKRWQAAIPKWEQRAAPLKGQAVCVQHTTWRYLADWLSLNEACDLEPKPGLPPTAGHLKHILQIAQKEKPIATLVAAYFNPRSAEWLEQRSGVPAVVLPYTVGGDEASSDLFSLYEQTLSILLEQAKLD
ncbi:periplasmic solute binding protein [gamma proteobacterium HTCC5015]|nr:periplasmic solute binding protein [gamma proteobacterium HTCC5015]